MFLLRLESERCPDGVVFERGQFNYRSDRRETVRRETSNLEDPVVMMFVNARDDEGRAAFFSQFGLLEAGDVLRRNDVLRYQKAFQELLARHEFAADMAALELFSERSFDLRPTFCLALDIALEVRLDNRTLLSFMLMETATATTEGTKLAACERCGAQFLTGPLTGRRSHARFCSDRCRVAAMRARNAERKALSNILK
jgi:hypothetical protein